MRLAICGSMSDGDLFLREYHKAAVLLASMGHEGWRPAADMDEANYDGKSSDQITESKADYLRRNICMIEAADGIMVMNYDHKGIPNYIGANTFFEMAIAYYLRKPIFMLNLPNPKQNIYDEVLGMKPTFLNGNLEAIG